MSDGDDWEGDYQPSPLMQLADDAGLGYWQLWNYLEGEVERRREQQADVISSAPGG